jgi:serine/threonine-protein phosphatase CPPED1
MIRAFKLAGLLTIWAAGALSQTPGPDGKDTKPFFFVQLADPQLEHAMDTANFEYAVAEINHLRPAFVVICGDLVENAGNVREIYEYFRIVSKIDPDIPVYNVPGNHDVENTPTKSLLEQYRFRFGEDYYSFRSGPLYGIVLNSTLIKDHTNVPMDFEAQENWLTRELAKAQSSGARHIVIFQHHPYFVAHASEDDAYWNIPREQRSVYLKMLRNAGVRYVFGGHLHRDVKVRDDGVEMLVAGAVSWPLGGASTGVGIAIVRDGEIEWRFYPFGKLPISIDPEKPLPPN